MKIYGYSRNNIDILEEMDEISIQADLKTIEAISRFFIEILENLKKGEMFDHVHLSDEIQNWSNDFPDIIVVPKQNYISR